MKDKTVIITGGAKGIGGASAHAFYQRGANVAIFDTDVERGKSLAEELGSRCIFLDCDISSAEAVRHAMEKVIAEFGGIDILVNNAGILSYANVVDTTEAEWDAVLGVNLKGAFLCAKNAIPEMQKRGAGVVINVASVQAYITQEKVAAYTTSKTALLGLTRSIAVDFAPSIRCVAICPGTIDTPMLQAAVRQSPDPDEVIRECEDMHLVKKIGSSAEVAKLIVYLASDDASFITGQAIRIDGGLGISIGGSLRD